jgi:hypothetical protein
MKMRELKKNKSSEQRFYERVLQRIGGLILHSVGATVLIMATILFGVKCATSGGYWAYVLSLIICIMVAISCIGAVVIDICNMLLFIKELYEKRC